MIDGPLAQSCITNSNPPSRNPCALRICSSSQATYTPSFLDNFGLYIIIFSRLCAPIKSRLVRHYPPCHLPHYHSTTTFLNSTRYPYTSPRYALFGHLPSHKSPLLIRVDTVTNVKPLVGADIIRYIIIANGSHKLINVEVTNFPNPPSPPRYRCTKPTWMYNPPPQALGVISVDVPSSHA